MSLPFETISTALSPLGWALVHFLWQGTLVAAGLAAVLHVLPTRYPNARYGAACAAMVLMLVLPFVTVTTTGVSGHDPSHRSILELAGMSERAEPVDGTTGGSSGNSVATGGFNVDSNHPDLANAGSLSGLSFIESGRPAQLLNQLTLAVESNLTWILGAWLLGVLFVGLVHIRGWKSTQSLRTEGISVAPESIQRMLRNASERVGVTRFVDVVISDKVDVPTTIGWMQPLVLLPMSAISGLSAAQLEAILLHELAHIRRYDYLVNLAQVVVETLLFYHPAVWWVSNRIRSEREHCCDDLAVDLVGSRVEYVRSLTAAESLRSPAMALAMRADGGSLVDRVRRLARLERRSDEGSRWFATVVLVPLVLLATLSVSTQWIRPAASQDSPGTDDEAIVEADHSIDHPYDENEIVEGLWEIKRSGSHMWMQLEAYSGRGRNSFGASLDEDEMAALEEIEGGLRLRREAGTFILEGSYDADRRRTLGRGDFVFYPDAVYPEKLEDLGVRRINGRRQFSFAAVDITTEYVRRLAAEGYDDLYAERLFEFAIHGVSPEYIKELSSLGYDRISEERLIEMRIHDVTPEFVQAMTSEGHDHLSTQDLVEMRIHDVDPELIHAFEDIGIEDVDRDRLVEMSIHGVTPEYVEMMRESGLDDLDLETMVQMRIHGVDARYIDTMREAGIKRVNVERLVEMKIHGVDEEYIADLAELGYDDLRPQELVEMKIHGIDAHYIERMAKLGYDDLPVDTLRDMKIHGVTPGFIKRLEERGYTGLSPRELIDIKIHGLGR